MIFKTLFFVIIITLTSNSYCQWWVSGGNILWPYGDVSITKGNLSVSGNIHSDSIITSSKFQHIILRFSKNGDDQEFSLTVYRNDTNTSVDTVYWSGGTYGTNYFIEFSGSVVSASSQSLFYNSTFIDAFADTGYVPTQLKALRSGYDNRIMLSFITPSRSDLDVFTVDVYVDLVIIPNTIADSYYYSW